MAKRTTDHELNSLLNPRSPQFAPVLHTATPRTTELLPGIGSTIMRQQPHSHHYGGAIGLSSHSNVVCSN